MVLIFVILEVWFAYWPWVCQPFIPGLVIFPGTCKGRGSGLGLVNMLSRQMLHGSRIWKSRPLSKFRSRYVGCHSHSPPPSYIEEIQQRGAKGGFRGTEALQHGWGRNHLSGCSPATLLKILKPGRYKETRSNSESSNLNDGGQQKDWFVKTSERTKRGMSRVCHKYPGMRRGHAHLRPTWHCFLPMLSLRIHLLTH